jgi:hypothetical protein
MTMKKKYISPITEEHVIQTSPLLGGSIVTEGDYASVEVDTSDDYDGVFGSRGGFFDDED